MNNTDTQRFNDAVVLASTNKAKAYEQLSVLLANNPNEPNLLLWLTFTAPTLVASESHLNALQQADPGNSSLSQAKSWLAAEKARQVIVAPPIPTPQAPNFQAQVVNQQPIMTSQQAAYTPNPQVVYVVPPQPKPKPSKVPYWITIGLSFVALYFCLLEFWVTGAVYEQEYGVNTINMVAGGARAENALKNIDTEFGLYLVGTIGLIIIFSGLVAIFDIKIIGNGWIILVLSVMSIVFAFVECGQLLAFTRGASKLAGYKTSNMTGSPILVMMLAIIIGIIGLAVGLKEKKLNNLFQQNV